MSAPDFSVAGQHVLISGGAGGIGTAFATAFRDSGAQVTICDLRPSRLYVTHEREMHHDHRAAVRIVNRTVSMLGETPPAILMYEVWTPLQDIDHIEDISEVIEDKVAAVRAYRTQCAAMRFDDAVMGLNRYRGEMHSWPGGPYAEVFRKPHE